MYRYVDYIVLFFKIASALELNGKLLSGYCLSTERDIKVALLV